MSLFYGTLEFSVLFVWLFYEGVLWQFYAIFKGWVLWRFYGRV